MQWEPRVCRSPSHPPPGWALGRALHSFPIFGSGAFSALREARLGATLGGAAGCSWQDVLGGVWVGLGDSLQRVCVGCWHPRLRLWDPSTALLLDYRNWLGRGGLLQPPCLVQGALQRGGALENHGKTRAALEELWDKRICPADSGKCLSSCLLQRNIFTGSVPLGCGGGQRQGPAQGKVWPTSQLARHQGAVFVQGVCVCTQAR